ncbi:MAG TPA: glycosyltransferase, partial [Galbitalea sp.]|nr:glycosyltransferase [Galbitalea sp.]
PERFRSHMYTCHFSVVRRTLAFEAGGFREGFDGAQDYDFVLRVTELARRVVHVPEILYHWRAHHGSTALDAIQKPTAFAAARRALEEHCKRSRIDAEVSDSIGLNTFRMRRRLRSKPLISLIVPTNGQAAKVRGQHPILIAHLIRSIEALTTYDNFEYVIVHDAKMPASTLATIKDACGDRPFVMAPYTYDSTGFNFSQAVNRGAVQSSGELLLLLNDDMELITPDWLEELASIVVDPDVGAVGGKFYFEDDTIQHAGVACAGGPIHLGYRLPRGAQPFGFHLTVTREVTALTGACLIVSRQDFFDVGGFTELLPNNFNDVDFCFKLRARGRRNVWTPYVEMYHFESKTRVNTVHHFETDLLTRRWGDRMRRDPYYNPNLVGSPPLWEPFHDWEDITRDWPRAVRYLGDLDTESYLERNPDVAAKVLENPAWDVAAHFAAHGRREGRIQSIKRQRTSEPDILPTP